jgi:hypothetical protein
MRFMPLMGKWIRTILVFPLLVPFASCKKEEPQTAETNPPAVVFDAETLKVPDRGVRKVRGQVLYMPVYSNIPYSDSKNYDLSAFLAIHNTDLKYKIRVTKVTLFNTEGKVVKQFVPPARTLCDGHFHDSQERSERDGRQLSRGMDCRSAGERTAGRINHEGPFRESGAIVPEYGQGHPGKAVTRLRGRG